MSITTIARFQLGAASAIEDVARTRGSIFVGIILVLLTAIPRSYDQTYFIGSIGWLFGPLLFSLFSGSYLFLVLYYGFIRRRLPTTESVAPLEQWRCFMSLFWLTAPTAWLYALPVEQFLTSYNSAKANLGLLATVSLWRILLMSKILSVVQGLPFPRALAWVLIPASIEVLIVVFFGGLFGSSFSRRVMAAMGGMRNAPEEELLLSALSTAFLSALVILVLAAIVLALGRSSQSVRPFPSQSRGVVPYASLFFIVLIWLAIAVPAQQKQHRFVAHAELIHTGKYRQSLDFLSAHNPSDFPPARRLEPNPYEYRAFNQLPQVVANLRAGDPSWVRSLYLDHLDVLFSHRSVKSDSDPVADMLLALDRTTDGKEWIQRNRAPLKKFVGRHVSGVQPQDAADRRLFDVLKRLGIAEVTEQPGTN